MIHFSACELIKQDTFGVSEFHPAQIISEKNLFRFFRTKILIPEASSGIFNHFSIVSAAGFINMIFVIKKHMAISAFSDRIENIKDNSAFPNIVYYNLQGKN